MAYADLQETITFLLGNGTWISVILGMATVALGLVIHLIKNSGLPPGPMGLPYLGILPFLRNEDAHLKLQKMAKTYGDLFSFIITGRLYINLSTIKLVRETQVSKSDCFQIRPQGSSLINLFFDKGVALQQGQTWRAVRKFFLTHLKESGMMSSKDHIAEIMQDAVKEMLQDVRQKNGELMDIMTPLTMRCSTILRHALFDERVVTDEQVQKLNEAFGVVVGCLSQVNYFLNGTIAKNLIFPFLPGYRNVIKNHNIMSMLLSEIIEAHKSTFKEDNIRDIIDSYIKERNYRQKKQDPTAKYFSDDVLRGTLYQFVGDGALSVAFFVVAFLISSGQYPEEQQKIYQELMDVVGTERLPTLEDKNQLHYTNAFMLETLRTIEFINFLPSMECTKETTLQGFRIPKGTITVINFWTAHHDPNVYEEPEKFNPRRFLPTSGKQRPELPINFGMGKRVCIGESYTMSQVFLFLTAIIQNFELSLPEGSSSTYYDSILKGEMKMRAIPRAQK